MKMGFDSLASKLSNLKLVLTTYSFNVLFPWKVYCCMFEDDINSHTVQVLCKYVVCTYLCVVFHSHVIVLLFSNTDRLLTNQTRGNDLNY